MNTINKNNSTHSQRNAVSEEHNAVSEGRNTAIEVSNLQFSYTKESPPIIDIKAWQVSQGEHVFLSGPSGSGKSTLLNLLGCLDKPTDGSLYLGDDDIAEMTDDELAEIRSTRIGFVFQSYNLIQQLSVVENIQVPLYYQGRLGANEKRRAMELAELVGLGDRLDHRPAQLSGGQQQRVAIARSLVNDPFFVLADEPTGNLDSVTTDEILAIFDQLNDEGRTIILVTHEDDVADRAKRIVRLKDGMLHTDEQVSEERRAAARLMQREAVEELLARE